MTPTAILTASLAGLMGACVASFTATAALRSLRGEQALRGRSRCDACAVSLGLGATLPIVSFLTLGGACRACGGRIDPVHPVAEVLGAGIAVLTVLFLSPNEAVLLFCLAMVLLAAAIIDLRSRRLPDVLTGVAALFSLALAALGGPSQILAGLLSATFTFVLAEALRRGFLAFQGKAALGFGDVKLMTALALWLGTGMPWAVALASLVGLGMAACMRPADGRVPFGPAIAVAALVVGGAMPTHIVPDLLESLG